MRASRGFTLLEAMIAVAIIGIVTAMSASTVSGIGARNAKQNAVNDVYSTLQMARARAQNGSDVYVIFYPTMVKATGALTGGSGAIFVYEDGNGDFRTNTGSCDGSATCGWAAFSPPNAIKPGVFSATNPDKLLAKIYLEDYPKKNVQFFAGTHKWAAPFSPIDTAANANGCSFCTSGNKGSILFSDNQVVFLDSAGKSTGTAMGGFVLAAKDNNTNKTLVGVIRATGLISLLK